MTDRPQFNTAADVRPSDEGPAASPDQVLWRQLTEAHSDEEFCTGWLGLLSRMIDGVISGMVVLGQPDKGPFVPAGFWPSAAHEHGHLASVTERALRERKGIIVKCDSEDDSGAAVGFCFHAAFPVRSQGRLCGAAAVELAPRPHDQLQTVMRQLQWGVAWLENLVLKSDIEQDALGKHRITTALDLAAVALQEERFRPSATAFATHLATSLRCDRVSVGFLKGKHVKVRAVSHSAQFKKQMNLIRSIGSAMDESVDQEAVLVYPDPTGESNRVLRSHAELVQQHGDGAICTIPFLTSDGTGYGALTLERSLEEPFTADDVQLGESIAALVAPVLEEKRKNDRLIIEKIAESLRLQLRKLFGPTHMARKAVAASAALLVLFFSIATWTYRVTAKTTIEGTVQRAVAAPYNGFVAEAHVRAGDTVSKGQVMCVLDNRDMVLERVKWASQREQYQRQYREAMATANRASMRILREQMNQANAQIALLDEQLARSSMTAPFDGIVVRGDLSQSLGAPVERGQVLFEVAPLEGYRIKLQVDERDIGWVKLNQTGDLLLNSLPNEHFPIRIENITSVSTASEGKNYFLVEAGLEQVTDRLRPGMEGVGKVEIGRRKLIWVLTHDLIDWVRLWVWSWWP